MTEITLTTAQWRNKAQDWERVCDWRLAAACWDQAILNYPNNGGAMARADIERMKARRDSCVDTLISEMTKRRT